jgi:hypothetical protein
MLVASGCGGDGASGDAGRSGGSSGTATEPAGTDPDEPTEPAVACTASELDPAPEVDDPNEAELPAKVAATRDALREAALACDFDALGELANHAGFAYEEGSGDNARYAAYARRVDEQDRLTARIVQLLALPSTTIPLDRGEVLHAWPSAHGEHPTAADWDALARSGAYSRQEVASFRRDGVYYGYRIGIEPDGDWSYMTAGG